MISEKLIQNIRAIIMIKLIKLFEIRASYCGLIKTWDTISERFAMIPDVSEYKLMKAGSDSSDYGYAAISRWTSLESFREALAKDVVLKYHFGGNVASKKNLSYNLFKSVDEKVFCDNHETVSDIHLYFFKEDLYQSEVKQHWNSIIDRLMKEKGFVSAELFKSMNIASKTSYLCTLNFSYGSFVQIELDSEKYHLIDKIGAAI